MAQHQTMLEYLNSLRLFKKLDYECLSTVLRNSDIEYFKSGNVVILEGMPSNHKIYFILDGTACVHMEGKLIATLGKGEIFGEYAPIFQKNRTATVTATSDLSCLILTKRTVLELIARGCGINEVIIKRIKENRKHQRGIFKNA